MLSGHVYMASAERQMMIGASLLADCSLAADC